MLAGILAGCGKSAPTPEPLNVIVAARFPGWQIVSSPSVSGPYTVEGETVLNFPAGEHVRGRYDTPQGRVSFDSPAIEGAPQCSVLLRTSSGQYSVLILKQEL